MDKADEVIPPFLFTTNTDSNEGEYGFDDAVSFNLPIIADNMKGVINIYARPKRGSFALSHIKTINVWMTKYRIQKDEPLNIIETINIKPLDEEYGEKGQIHICSHSQIIINKTAQINANECGMNKEMSSFYCDDNAQKNEEETHLTFGTFADASLEQKMDFENVGNECGGGIIELVSQSNIVNNGALTSNASNTNYLGGTIWINTNKSFIN
eukprot:185347_1